MEIISRKTALMSGRLKFFTGRPCKHGHISERYTSTGNCILCNRVNNVLILGGYEDQILATRQILESLIALNDSEILKKRVEAEIERKRLAQVFIDTRRERAAAAIARRECKTTVDSFYRQSFQAITRDRAERLLTVALDIARRIDPAITASHIYSVRATTWPGRVRATYRIPQTYSNEFLQAARNDPE